MYKVIAAPTSEPLTLMEAQTYLRTDEDISALITAAREYCEDFQSKIFMTRTIEFILDKFPCGAEIEFSNCSPIQSVTNVKYYGTDNTEYTFDTTNYIVDPDSFVSRIVLAYGKSWPTTILRPIKGVIIRCVAGYGNDAFNVPETVKQAMVLHMKVLGNGTLFNLRVDEIGKLEKARDVLLRMNKVVPL